ncbi:hypothetical protein R5P86_04430 [Oenococcus oeni]|nr:hypothetical protein [Oenococcus oeni]
MKDYKSGLKDMRNTVKAVLDSEEIPFDLYYLIVRRMDERIEANK